MGLAFSNQNTPVMKFARAISRVKWLNGEKSNVSKTVSAFVPRVLIWMWLDEVRSGHFITKISLSCLYLSELLFHG